MELNNKKTTLVVSCLALTMLGHSPHVQAVGVRAVNSITQQSLKIRGQVTDGKEAIIGATVKEKGTNNATITDLDGNFSLSVKAGSTLVISYVGYVTKEVKVTGQSTYQVTLSEDNVSLNEVVVVGYGSMKKSDVSGASVTMDEKKLRGSIVISLDQTLQGRAAGVTATSTSGAPGTSSSIRVRGQATINANAEPLYVIDGVIIQSSGAVVHPMVWVMPWEMVRCQQYHLSPQSIQMTLCQWRFLRMLLLQLSMAHRVPMVSFLLQHVVERRVKQSSHTMV